MLEPGPKCGAGLAGEGEGVGRRRRCRQLIELLQAVLLDTKAGQAGGGGGATAVGRKL